MNFVRSFFLRTGNINKQSDIKKKPYQVYFHGLDFTGEKAQQLYHKREISHPIVCFEVRGSRFEVRGSGC